MTTRRRFFSKVAALAVGLLGVTACGKETETSLSSEPDRKLLDAFVDTIVPNDQDPGAVEAGVTDKLLVRFEEKQEEKKNAMAMLASIDLIANNKFNTGFKNLNLDQREKVLYIFQHSRDKKDQPARNTLQHLRTRIIRSFYLSPAGRTMLAYTPPYPMGYPDYNSPPPG